MTRIFGRMEGAVTALAVAGALGFGASQAVAAPRSADRLACTTSQRSDCIRDCWYLGGYAAECVNGICFCAMPPGGPGGGATPSPAAR